jgi:hypothetical protein
MKRRTFDPRTLADPRLFALICTVRSGRRGLRVLAPAGFGSAANQLIRRGDQRPVRPFERAVRFAPVPSQIGGCSPRPPAVVRIDIGIPWSLATCSAARCRSHGRGALICGLCSGRRLLRPLAPPVLADAANQRSFTDPLGFSRPFVPSSPRRPDTRLRAERIGVSTFATGRREASMSPSDLDLINHVPLPPVTPDSDFPWEITIRFFDAQKIFALRASGALRGKPISPKPKNT